MALLLEWHCEGQDFFTFYLHLVSELLQTHFEQRWFDRVCVTDMCFGRFCLRRWYFAFRSNSSRDEKLFMQVQMNMKTLGMENVVPTAVDVSISAFKTCTFVGEGGNLHCQDGDFHLYTKTHRHTLKALWMMTILDYDVLDPLPPLTEAHRQTWILWTNTEALLNRWKKNGRTGPCCNEGLTDYWLQDGTTIRWAFFAFWDQRQKEPLGEDKNTSPPCVQRTSGM